MTPKPTRDRPIVATSSRIVYENPWTTVREDEIVQLNGTKGIYGVVETKDSVIVAALNGENEIYLVYGYSYPSDTWSWQIPGGGGEGESPDVAAARELKEETGMTADKYEILANLIITCGVMTERMAVIVASGLTFGDRPSNADDIDSIGEGKFVTFEEIKQMIRNGEICDSQTISGLYLVEKWVEIHGN